MKKHILFTTFLLLLITLAACNSNKEIDIVTSSFFEHDIVRHIALDNLKYETLIKPGTDNHDFEPTSKQIKIIKNSKLFIFTSYELHGWLNNNAESLVSKNSILLNLSNYNNLEINDLHYWTDPVLILDFINIIAAEIIKIDPVNESLYLENALNYYNKINNLTILMNNYFEGKEIVNLYLSGHNSLIYFEKRFNINIHALIDDIKPDADLTSKQIVLLINEIKNNNIDFLFTPELTEPKVAETIKNELRKDGYDLTLLPLHSYHNVSLIDYKANVSYYDLMLRNFDNIKKALGN